MEYKIIRCNYEDVKKVNNLLTKLIKDEKKYDENINEGCVVTSLYENFYDNDDVCLLVAKNDENILGYIYGYIQNNGDAKLEKVSVLDALYVEENVRCNKIGDSLIEEFKKWSYDIGAKYIELKVCNANSNAINLYAKKGFKETKIMMTLKLEEEYENI